MDVEPGDELQALARLLAILAEKRADQAVRREASLRAALAVVTSVAEVSIETAAQLMDEARRYAHLLPEAIRQEETPNGAPSSADAVRVIAEARAMVAALRADLFVDDPDSEPAAEGEATVEPAGHDAPHLRGGDRREHRTPGDMGGAVRAAASPPQDRRPRAAPSSWVSPRAERTG